jgi:putative transposase
MSNLRRYYTPGQTYFVTIVTYDHLRILIQNGELFRTALDETITEHNAELSAWAVLPDHVHLILMPSQDDLSRIIHKLKTRFTARLRSLKGKRNGRIWQNRFWDHIIRDQKDMNKHIDYIHYNPIKHGLSQAPFTYKYSSAPEFLKDGFYEPDWGTKGTLQFDGEFGE